MSRKQSKDKDYNSTPKQKLVSIVEEFYKLKSPRDLAALAFNKKKCRKFFLLKRTSRVKLKESLQNLNAYLELKDKKSMVDREIAQESARLSIGEIVTSQLSECQKNINPRFNKLVRNKMRTQLLTDEERRETWLLATRALLKRSQNPHYYEKLLQIKDYPSYFEHSVKVDVNRTYTVDSNKQIQEKHRETLQRVLLQYARRNSTIGYCQGMNYIASFLIEQGFSEEECFWLYTQMIESIIPIDYYPNMMLGVIGDQKIFDDLLSVHNPQLQRKFAREDVHTGLFLTQWFVCLFTQNLQPDLLKVAWDHLLLKGNVALLKIALVVLELCQEELNKHQGLEVIAALEKQTHTLKDAYLFNKKLNELYISNKAVQYLRDLYQQLHLQSLGEQQAKDLTHLINFDEIECRQQWPVCVHRLEIERVNQHHSQFNIILQSTCNMKQLMVQEYFKTEVKPIAQRQNQSYEQEHQQQNNSNSDNIKDQDFSVVETMPLEQSRIAVEFEEENEQSDLLIARTTHICNDPQFYQPYKNQRQQEQQRVIQEKERKIREQREKELGEKLEKIEKHFIKEQDEEEEANGNGLTKEFLKNMEKSAPLTLLEQQRYTEASIDLDTEMGSNFSPQRRKSSNIQMLRRLTQKSMHLTELLVTNVSSQNKNNKVSSKEIKNVLFEE